MTTGLLEHVALRPRSLDDYAAIAHLAQLTDELVAEAKTVAPDLQGRTIWMVNSTATGGGVAEMLVTMVPLLNDLGIRTEWVVLGADDERFFRATKHVHNLLHGEGEATLGDDERALYENVNRANAAELSRMVKPGDILVVHDPQPLPLARILRETTELTAIWRCHIGSDEENAATRAGWAFLAPYLDAYDSMVFSAPEYVPKQFADRSRVINPGIDPLAEKNRELTVHALVAVMCNGGLAVSPGPTLRAPFLALAERVLPDGRLVPASVSDDIGLLTRPIVTQVSRWDRLKGFGPLMQAFADLKRSVYDADPDSPHRRRLDLVRLVLAGPDTESIQDDPEGREVFDALITAYRDLHPAIQDDIAIVCLPMRSAKENALIVNALQRTSTIVVQNSLREGFGLTIAEAMWKRVPVLSNSRACGPRQQVRDGQDGRLIADPRDVTELRQVLNAMLADRVARRRWGRSAQRRVHDRFLNLDQLQSWARLLHDVA